MALKAAGHHDPMGYTPRQLFAWHHAETRRQNRALAMQALAIRRAYHADADGFEAAINALSK